VGKAARRGGYLTNVARGGTVYRCPALFQASGLPVMQTQDRIRSFSRRVTACLASKLRRLSDVGLDIGVDSSGKLYLIEVNGRDQRYSFAKAGMKQEFYNTYANPMRYAAYLAKRRG